MDEDNMPQPLSRVRPKARVLCGPGPQLFEHRPGFSKYLSVIVAQWAYNEANLFSILAFLLQSEARTVTAIMQKILSAKLQFSLIAEAATHKLEEPELEAIQAILLVAKSGAETRNELLHNVWGFCDELPDAIILVKQYAYLDQFVRMIESRRSGSIATEASSPDVKYCTVYKDSDFDNIIKDMLSISRCTSFVINFIHKQHSGRDHIYSMLLAEPLFQTALSRVRKARLPQ